MMKKGLLMTALLTKLKRSATSILHSQLRDMKKKMTLEEVRAHLKSVLPLCKGLKTGVFLSALPFATQAKIQMCLHLTNIWIGLLNVALNLLGSLHICQQATVL